MKRTILALCAAIFFASCQTVTPIAHEPAPVARQGERALDWPHQESDLTPDPAVRYGRLANGMRYAIMANHTPSNTASVRLRFDVGALMEAEDQRGLAHFLEHMAFNGSANVPEGEMVQILQRHGLAFGADTNAHTSFEETVYKLDAPNVQPATLDTIFFLLRETAGNLTIADEAVERERGVVLSEERQSNTPGFRSLRAQWTHAFGGALMTERFPIGSREVIAAAPAQRIRDLYDAYYRPERAFFVIIGDVDPDAMEAKIRDTFGDWSGRGEDPGDPDLGAPQRPSVQAGYFADAGLPTSVSLLTVRPATLEANTFAQVRRAMLRGIGNAIVQRRLQTLSRQPDAVFFAGRALFADLFDSASVAEVDVFTRPEQWQDALALGERELRRALQHGFTQAEIDEQLAELRTAYETGVEQAATRSNAALANAIVTEFGRWGVFVSPADELALFNRIAPEVTPANVAAAFNAQWRGGEPLVFLSTSAELESPAETIAAAYAQSQAVAVTPPAQAGAQAFAYTDFGTPGRVVERREIEDLGITQVRFENNVRLNLKRTAFRRDSVAVFVRFGGGVLELPKSEPGLDNLIAALGAGGLEAHSADELQRLMAGRNVGVRYSVGGENFVLSGATTPADLTLEMQLLAASLTAPGYREEGLAQFRQAIDAQFRSLASTPAGVAARDVPRLLRSGDPRYGIAAREELLARSYDEARAALARAASEGAIEIGVVGDIDIDAAIAAAAATFGALPPRAEAEPDFTEARRLAFPAPPRSPVTLRHEGQADRAQILTYWPATDDSDIRRARTLQMLRAVLQWKVLNRVREADGASYSPSAQAFLSHVNPGYGFLGVSIDLAPADVERYFGVIDEIAAELAAGAISADELERARRPIIEDFSRTLEDNNYWLGIVSRAQSDPDLLARHRSTVADYEAVTIADLTAAARTYLAPRRAYRIAILPPATAN